MVAETVYDLIGVVDGHASTTDASVTGTHTGKGVEVDLELLVAVGEVQGIVLILQHTLLLAQSIHTLAGLNGLTTVAAARSVILAEHTGLLRGLLGINLEVGLLSKAVAGSHIKGIHILILIVVGGPLTAETVQLMAYLDEPVIDLLQLLLLGLTQRLIHLGILHVEVHGDDTRAFLAGVPCLVIPVTGHLLRGREPEAHLS